MDKEKYVEIIRFDNLNQALITKGLLDSFGIPNEIMNDMVYGTIPTMKSGVRIMINESDYARAREVLSAKFSDSELS